MWSEFCSSRSHERQAGLFPKRGNSLNNARTGIFRDRPPSVPRHDYLDVLVRNVVPEGRRPWIRIGKEGTCGRGKSSFRTRKWSILTPVRLPGYRLYKSFPVEEPRVRPLPGVRRGAPCRGEGRFAFFPFYHSSGMDGHRLSMGDAHAGPPDGILCSPCAGSLGLPGHEETGESRTILRKRCLLPDEVGS